ncbi:MAG: hypothetical protein P8141_12840 [Gammaproteobacteria bacterium]
MNKVALGVGLVLSLMSWSAVAEEQGSMREASPSIEEQCRVMAVQHGMKEDNLDAWVKKCVEISEKMQNDRGMGENDDSNDMNDNNDMQDSEEGDSDMGDVRHGRRRPIAGSPPRPYDCGGFLCAGCRLV